ncbi:MFS transporter [Arcanobacterium bovis]|uniref:MFS transporter n=1 Tax=Arcanobacterium bovis TaxID=2529275 RepID=UPI0019D51DB2|nr:MFS transporter [Arcanobacterium bovis]
MSVAQDFLACVKHRELRKLLAVRLASQIGDGIFQAGLASLFFFNPQKLASATDVAVAFAVLLLPFTLVGPFAGVFIDRWRRRNVLVGASAIRAVCTLVTALLVMNFPGSWGVYVGALIVLGVNRFLLSALSAALPHTLPGHLLLLANSIIPTLGGIAAGCGAALGAVVALMTGQGEFRNVLLLVIAALMFITASLLASRFSPNALGPHGGAISKQAAESIKPISSEIGSVIASLIEAAKYLITVRTPTAALAIMAVHRFIYGMNFIALVLMSRNLLADPRDPLAGLAVFAAIASVSIVGNVLAIVAIPLLNEKYQPRTLIMCCLGVSAVSQVMLVLGYTQFWISASALLLGFSVQGAKISVDTIVQRDTADEYRGRAFSLYDMLFNSAFVSAGAVAALTIPDSGWSPMYFGVLVVINLLLIAWYQGKIRENYDPGMTQK